MNRWTGCVAVVTGASVGIGASICEKLAKLGINVVAMARRLPEMEELASKLTDEPGKVHPLKCDLRNEDETKACFAWIEENLGGISILINNAGILTYTTIIDGDSDSWRAQFDVNVIGLCICTREAVASMNRHNIDGHIIHMNSIVGHYVPTMAQPFLNVYPATKHALTALGDSIYKELRFNKSKIKVTSIHPGIVRTELFLSCPAELQGALVDMPGLMPENVADVCIYALSTPPDVEIIDLTIRPLGEVI